MCTTLMDKVSEESIAGVFLELGIASVKLQQLDVVSAVLNWDEFAISPTTFGKSDCFPGG